GHRKYLLIQRPCGQLAFHLCTRQIAPPAPTALAAISYDDWSARSSKERWFYSVLFPISVMLLSSLESKQTQWTRRNLGHQRNNFRVKGGERSNQPSHSSAGRCGCTAASSFSATETW